MLHNNYYLSDELWVGFLSLSRIFLLYSFVDARVRPFLFFERAEKFHLHFIFVLFFIKEIIVDFNELTIQSSNTIK